ncbi:MAG: hypothetical protein F6K54_23430 [Okeania sp. SIO3B5]|nr:hypothetical protein [Okeania sp. SIO3B5]NEO55762.1 hypothetical protein [Okeania sp. SIO3B5]
MEKIEKLELQQLIQKEEGRKKKEEGRRKKEEGRRKKEEEGRRKKVLLI